MARAELLVSVVFFYCLLVVAPLVVKGELTCDQVISDLAPCATYLINGGTVPKECCDSAISLNSVATTTADRQMVCTCIEQTAETLPDIKLDNAQSLPGKCGIEVDFDISLNTNCTMVH